MQRREGHAQGYESLPFVRLESLIQSHAHLLGTECDVRKFFASIDQTTRMNIVSSYIPEKRILALISEVVSSFCSCCTQKSSIHTYNAIAMHVCIRKGLPLGNLTSQLLVNIYMNEFDQYVKHALKAKHYIRYADDFVVLSDNKHRLQALLPYMVGFLRNRLTLELHPEKVFIKSLASGVDFLGWVHFPDHRVLRTATKRRMNKRTAGEANEAILSSYIGLLTHGNAERVCEPLREKLKSLK